MNFLQVDWRRSDWIAVSSQEEYKNKINQRQGKNWRAVIEGDWYTITKWKKARKNIGQVGIRKRRRMAEKEEKEG